MIKTFKTLPQKICVTILFFCSLVLLIPMAILAICWGFFEAVLESWEVKNPWKE